jgi:aminoglycoside phosphotransferase (APT) family kinase protein
VWSVLYGEGRAALHDAIRSMIGSRGTLGACRLRRATFKPRRKLTGYYDIVLDGVPKPTLTAVTWSVDEVSASAPQLDAAQEGLRDAGISTALDRLWAVDPANGMLVLAAPLDSAIPSLGHLSDPRRVPEVLASCGAMGGNGGHSVLHHRYRPGRKHVLEYRSPSGSGIFVKLYRPDAAGQFASAATAFSDLVAAAAIPGVRALPPEAVLSDSGAVLYRWAPGTPLWRWLRSDQPAAANHLRRVGRLLRAVHSSVPQSGTDLRERDRENEVRAVFRACEAITVLRPELGTAAMTVAERARDRLAAREQEPATVVHGDVKADHVLCTPDGITVLDTDRCAMSDPALDLGKLLADLRWWSSIGSGFDVAAADAALLDGYQTDGSRWARAQLYAALLLVKMASRRVPAASRGWASRTADLVALAAQGLDGACRVGGSAEWT